MHRDLGPLQLAVTVTCLAICPPAPGQRAPKGIQPALTTSDAASAQAKENIEERLYLYIDRDRYRNFIDFVGREEKQIESGDGARTDYESALGIGDGDESAMIQVVLEASPAMIETWNAMDELTRNLLDQHERLESIANDPKLKELAREQERLVAEVRAGLEREGSKVLLRNVDAYVFREFIHREAPLSAWRRDTSRSEESTRLDRVDDRYHEQLAFATFFQIVGGMRDGDNKSRDADSARLIPRCTPKERREQVISIVRQTNEELQMGNLAEDAMIGVYHQQNGPQPMPIEEFTSSIRAFWKTVNDGKQKLRATLGESTFKTFAREVDDAFGSDLYEEARSSSTTQHLP